MDLAVVFFFFGGNICHDAKVLSCLQCFGGFSYVTDFANRNKFITVKVIFGVNGG